MSIHKIKLSDEAERLLTSFPNTAYLGKYISRLIERDKLMLALHEQGRYNDRVWQCDLTFVTSLQKKTIHRILFSEVEKVIDPFSHESEYFLVDEDTVARWLKAYANAVFDATDYTVVTVQAYLQPELQDQFCLYMQK
jgi:hypothetical protein